MRLGPRRVFRFKRLVERYDDQIRPFLNGSKIVGLSVAIIFIAHVVGCLWFYAGSADQLMKDGTVIKGWTRNYPGWEECDVHSLETKNENGTLENCTAAASRENQYLTALYWCGTPLQHGLTSNAMALITSDCGAMLFLSTSWP